MSDPQKEAALEQEVATLVHALDIDSATWSRFQEHMKVLKAHNPLMYAHSLRVGIYAARIAAAEGRAYARLALFGGCGHDLGKCDIPNRLLNADGITPSEFEQIKEHAQLGFESLKDDFLFTGLVAGLHHSYQDNGYGIDLDTATTTELSPGAKAYVQDATKLVALCDFYDAVMTRDNSKGWLKDPNSLGEKHELLITHFPHEEDRVGWLLQNTL